MARKRRKQSKRHLQTAALFSTVIFFALLVCFSVVKAGSLDSSSAPAATMYTLQDIYTRLTTNAEAGSHNLGPSASPAATMRTLTEIYNAIPAIDATKVKLGKAYLGVDGTLVPSGGDVQTSQVCSGATFFGSSQTNWTLQAGALSVDASKVLYGTTYCGTAGTYNTTNLTVGNVKNGITFGVSSTGTLLPNDGTAAVADLFIEKTAQLTSDWTLDTGTLTLACSISSFNGTANKISDAYDGSGDGTNRWCITNSTNSASASDIATGKKAWAAGIELTGIGVVETGTGTGSVATSSQIASNYYAWGSDGAVVQGSITAGSNVAGSNGNLVITIPDALYSGSRTATAADTNLLSNYIKDNISVFGVTGNIGLPKTGQTTVYTAGDDGTYQSGAPHSPQARFTDNTDGTITDNATGLMWEKCSEGLSDSSCTTGSATSMVWSSDWGGPPNAITQCEDSTSNGHTDWRLPNIKELQSIVDYSVVSPAINTTYFPATQTDGYWSSTTDAVSAGSAYAWLVNFYDGDVYGGSKSLTYYVWCVRQ